MKQEQKLVLFSVKIPFYQEDREDRDTAVPQCNELCIVTGHGHAGEKREKVSFIHDATHAEGTYKAKTLGSRLGSLY